MAVWSLKSVYDNSSVFLKTVKAGSNSTSYDYDVFNLRTRKTGGAGNVNYITLPIVDY